MENHRVAVFIDFDNIRIGIRQHFNAEFSPHKLMAKAARYGAVIEAKAYADFTEYAKDFRDRLLFAAGIQPVHAPVKISGGRRQSSADLHMVMDIFTLALDRADIDTIVLMTGDGDFVRMVALLRHRFGKRVVICGVKGTSTSLELMNAADLVDPITPAETDPPGTVSGPPRPRQDTGDRADRVAPVQEKPKRGPGFGNLLGSLLGNRKDEPNQPTAQATGTPEPNQNRNQDSRHQDQSRGRRGGHRRGGAGGERDPQTTSTRQPSQVPPAAAAAGDSPQPAPTGTVGAGSAPTREPRAEGTGPTSRRPRRAAGERTTGERDQAPRAARPAPPPRELTPELTSKLVVVIDRIEPTRGGYLTWKVIEENLRAHAAENGWTRKEATGLLEALTEEGIVARMTRMRGQTEQQIGELVREHPMVQAALAAGTAEPALT